MTLKTCTSLLLYFVLSATNIFANNPPVSIGQWRIHLPYRNVTVIEETKDKIYCAGAFGLYSYDRGDGFTERLSPINGFGGYKVQAMAYEESSDQLIIAYADCRLEILKGKSISRNDDIFNKSIVGEKTIFHINIVDGIAYISTSFGLLEFNIAKNEIRNSYLNIGPGGSVIEIFSSCINNDSIYISTKTGVYRGSTNPNVNLGISSNWILCKSASIKSSHIAAYKGSLYTEIDSQIYRYNTSNGWTVIDPNPKVIVTNIDVDHDKLIIGIYGKYITTIDGSGNSSNKGVNVLNECLLDGNGNYWYSSPISGLAFMNPFGPEMYFYPNGPRSHTSYSMVNAYGNLYVTAGGLRTTTYAPTFNGEKYYYFNNFEWTNSPDNPLTQPLYDYTHSAFSKQYNRLFIGTHGKGLLQMDNGEPKKVWDETNSPLKGRLNIYTIISGLALDSRSNLWVSNFDVDSSLHMLSASGKWTSYKMPTSMTGKIAIDNKNNKWILTPQAGLGIIAFSDRNTIDHNDDIKVVLNINKGTGNLPSANVNDIAFTKSGELLIGTDQGYAKIRTPQNVFGKGDYDAQRVIISVEANSNLGGYLLGSEVINCITIDGGDRRWFGTSSGAWLIDSDGETILKHFTKDNSPLMSDNVTSIAIMESTGEVFMGTDLGMVSYRSDALPAMKNFETLKIYPNPVKPEYDGDIAISGMPDNTLVKITDINGNLVNQTYSNGSMATWNGKTFDGTRASSGVYLVFCMNQDGTETQVGKILFIH